MIELLGKEIEDIFLSECKTILVFQSDYEIFTYKAEADCCSESYFEDIINPEVLIYQKVMGIELKDTTETKLKDAPDSNKDMIRVYGYTLKTLKGYCDIAYRNESNGYYRGWCNLIDAEILSCYDEDAGCSLRYTKGLKARYRNVDYKLWPMIEDEEWRKLCPNMKG